MGAIPHRNFPIADLCFLPRIYRTYGSVSNSDFNKQYVRSLFPPIFVLPLFEDIVSFQSLQNYSIKAIFILLTAS
jgi:hypothetical protein